MKGRALWFAPLDARGYTMGSGTGAQKVRCHCGGWREISTDGNGGLVERCESCESCQLPEREARSDLTPGTTHAPPRDSATVRRVPGSKSSCHACGGPVRYQGRGRPRERCDRCTTPAIRYHRRYNRQRERGAS